MISECVVCDFLYFIGIDVRLLQIQTSCTKLLISRDTDISVFFIKYSCSDESVNIHPEDGNFSVFRNVGQLFDIRRGLYPKVEVVHVYYIQECFHRSFRPEREL